MFGLSKRALLVIGVLIVVVAVFVIQNKGKSNAQTGSGGSGGCQVQVTADALNVRESAGGTAKVVDKLAGGNTSAATSTVQNGYRELATGRWASDQFLKKLSGPC